MARFDDAHRTDDDAALAFELLAARRVTADLRKAVSAFAVWLLAFHARMAGPDGTLTAAQEQQLRAAADAGLAALTVDVAARTTAAVTAATKLAVRQERPILASHGIDAATLDVVHTDPPLLHAGDDTARILDAAVTEARHFASVAPLATVSDVQVLAAKAAGTVGRVERQVRFVTNRAINQTTLEIAKATAAVEAPVAALPVAEQTPVPTRPVTVVEAKAPEVERTPLARPGMRVVWYAERGACLVCQALSGQVGDPNEGVGFDEFATFGKPGSAPDVWPPGMPLMAPPRHPNCLPGDALVTPSGRITGATARVYDGELVEIRTLNQKVFTATPNHPVLTDRGWVPIGSVDQGSYVVGTCGNERMLVGDDNDQHMPARIQDVAETFLRSSNVVSSEVPLSAEDFHGDGVGSQIAVVGADRTLSGSLHAAVCQKHRKVPLEGADVATSKFIGAGALQPLLETVNAPSGSVVRGLGQAGAFLGAGLRHAGIHAGASISGLNPSFQQYSTDRRPADAVDFGDRLLARSGFVELDEVLGVRRYPFLGHVYNLETSEGWYIGNHIVTHNCRCRLRIISASNTVIPEALQREAQRTVARGWSDHDSKVQRLSAADRLLARSTLPKTVQIRARADVEHGAFSTRHRPKAPELRDN